ncbi:hypothetical protein VTO42DRAFT_91 [Malbranchea cinnamomea]
MTEAGRSLHGASEYHLYRPSPPRPSSPETADWKTHGVMTSRTSVASGNEMEHSERRLSIDTGVSDYDHLSRSPLFEYDHQPGPSGLPRIRQQPQSRLQARAFSLPATSLSSSASASATPCPSSATSSVTGSLQFPPAAVLPGLEDLHRFPSESLHSFSFAQPSEELLHSRYNVLKRSINFMKDRGWVPAADVARTDEPDVQEMIEMASRTNLVGTIVGHSHGGAVTGPADLTGENVFERAFGEHAIAAPTSYTHPPVKEEQEQIVAMDQQQPLAPGRTFKTAPSSRRGSLKRTYTDLDSSGLQSKLMDAYAQPLSVSGLMSPGASSYGASTPAVHTHSSKWSPVPQAVFRTEAKPRWTILAANDLACLVFGITQKEFRKLSVLDLIQQERRAWLEARLGDTPFEPVTEKPKASRFAHMGNGVTAQLLSKPPAREKLVRRSTTGDGYDRLKSGTGSHHLPTKSRGVLLCGDVVPIRKRNGSTGSASLWVMEKRGGLIWVVEEIVENVAQLEFDAYGELLKAQGDIQQIWGRSTLSQAISIFDILPHIPQTATANANPDYPKISSTKYFTTKTSGGMDVPVTVESSSNLRDLRVSSFPHIAGMMVVSSSTLDIISANPVFSAALFGRERPKGLRVTELLPNFDTLLGILTEDEGVPLVDGVVISEQSFRRARALSILREGKAHLASLFSHPTGLPARHRDGGQIMVDVQMRVVKSETFFPGEQMPTVGENEELGDGISEGPSSVTEVVYALWVTYSRQLQSANESIPRQISERKLEPRRSMPEDLPEHHSPTLSFGGDGRSFDPESSSRAALLSQKLAEAASEPLTDKPAEPVPEVARKKEVSKKKTISDYVILEDMGQGAYGQVKLARSKMDPTKKVVLKYVTKKRILVDTWTRDRKLGTVPLEIHVLNHLRQDHLRHPNIVEMEGFFEDDINYYIEMTPHGLPGMDLFDYVELRSSMTEDECRNIFRQVVDAICHLHTKAMVVHRDIKDENVILDGEGRIKLIDFGSAAYIRNGPFDVFVGTIDYAAPEVLQGKPYMGKEQDVWALGILLYTMIYKENPFYNINEIMDHPLRIPFLPFSESCIDLIQSMLNREVDDRLTIVEVLNHPWMRGIATMDGSNDRASDRDRSSG